MTVHARGISLAVVLAWVACARDAAPPQPPSNKVVAPERFQAAADPLGFLPIDADIVLGLDVRALRASALWAEVQPRLTQAIGSHLADIHRTCGVDPIQAIDSITMAAYSKETSSPVVVVRGLDRDRTIACIESKLVPDTTVTRDHGIAMITAQGGSGGLAAFADPATLVVESANQTTPDGLRAVLRGGSPLRSSPAFLAMFDGLERGATLWILVNGKAGVFDQLAGTGVPLLAAYCTIRVTSGVLAKAHLRMARADEATQLTALIQGQTRQAASLFDRLDVAVEGNIVTITVELSLDKLRSLVSMFMTLIGSAGTSP